MGWVTEENLAQIVSRRKWPPRYYTQTCKTRPNAWSEVKYFSGWLETLWVHHSSPGAKSMQESRSSTTNNLVVWIQHQNPTHIRCRCFPELSAPLTREPPETRFTDLLPSDLFIINTKSINTIQSPKNQWEFIPKGRKSHLTGNQRSLRRKAHL